MRLKSLEIHGFKSFADKTKLEFHEGVTGIVGPNGCGKSNIVDSMRWVLGETSAKALRGGEMSDVIFNGTDKRSPLGMAEVTLTLSGCSGILATEYDEVSLGRRVFRDGKSEYLINKQPCRLKELGSKPYTVLARELGLRGGTVINAATKGIKRYDYALWREAQRGEGDESDGEEGGGGEAETEAAAE